MDETNAEKERLIKAVMELSFNDLKPSLRDRLMIMPWAGRRLGLGDIDPSDTIFTDLTYGSWRKHTGEYRSGWCYVTQSAHGTGTEGLGLEAHLGIWGTNAVIGLHKRPADGRWHFVVTPVGSFSDTLLCEKSEQRVYYKHIALDVVCRLLYGVSKTPVYVKKLTMAEYEMLRPQGRYALASDYPWHTIPLNGTEVIHSEDDTFPEQEVALHSLVRDFDKKGRGYHDIRLKLAHFRETGLEEKLVIRDYDREQDSTAAWEVVQEFFKYPEKRLLSQPEDYVPMIHHPPVLRASEKYLRKIAFLDGKPVAFIMGEHIGKDIVGLYANIILSCAEGISEYILMQYFRELYQKGIHRVNWGGCEIPTLRTYKKKFGTTEKEQRFWAVYKPETITERLGRHLQRRWLPYVLGGCISLIAVPGGLYYHHTTKSDALLTNMSSAYSQTLFYGANLRHGGEIHLVTNQYHVDTIGGEFGGLLIHLGEGIWRREVYLELPLTASQKLRQQYGSSLGLLNNARPYIRVDGFHKETIGTREGTFITGTLDTIHFIQD